MVLILMTEDEGLRVLFDGLPQQVLLQLDLDLLDDPRGYELLFHLHNRLCFCLYLLPIPYNYKTTFNVSHKRARSFVFHTLYSRCKITSKFSNRQVFSEKNPGFHHAGQQRHTTHGFELSTKKKNVFYIICIGFHHNVSDFIKNNYLCSHGILHWNLPETDKVMEMKIAYNNRNPYEAPEAEELIVRFEDNILSLVQGGGGERTLDEAEAGF